MAVIGYQSQIGKRLSAELLSRATEAATITAVRTKAAILRAYEPHRDTGAVGASVSVEVIGGHSLGLPRDIGVIAVANAKAADWLDKGTANDGSGYIRRPNRKDMPVGKRSPNRPNAGSYGGTISYLDIVRGQRATHFFSAPQGVPLNEMMRNVFAGIYRRTR